MKNDSRWLGFRLFALAYVAYLLVDIVQAQTRGETGVSPYVMYPIVAVMGLAVVVLVVVTIRNWRRNRAAEQEPEVPEEAPDEE